MHKHTQSTRQYRHKHTYTHSSPKLHQALALIRQLSKQVRRLLISPSTSTSTSTLCQHAPVVWSLVVELIVSCLAAVQCLYYRGVYF